MAGIVVGVDGSPHSQKALEWALAESELRNVPLKALVTIPTAASIWSVAGESYMSKEGRDKIHKAARDEVDKAVEGHSYKNVTVHTVDGVPADELVKASQDADLLVVGARGAGGFARLRMGSVSSQVSAHAHCPVVVVPWGNGH